MEEKIILPFFMENFLDVMIVKKDEIVRSSYGLFRYYKQSTGMAT